MSASVELLKAARAKIADPANWTRYRLARNNKGNAIKPDSKSAVCWCAHGALRAVGIGLWEPEEIALYKAAEDLYSKEPYEINDYCDHADVISMFDRAICIAEASNA